MEKEIESKIEIIKVGIPAELIVTDSGHFILSTTDKSEELIGSSIVCQGDTLEEAESEFLKMMQIVTEHHRERSLNLNLWKPFQRGPRGKIGGSWFTVFGLHFYFRKGKNMKYGWYIPLTNINIIFKNYWLK